MAYDNSVYSIDLGFATPPNGSEVLSLDAGPCAVRDTAQICAPSAPLTITLHDLLRPNLTAAAALVNNTISLAFSEAVFAAAVPPRPLTAADLRPQISGGTALIGAGIALAAMSAANTNWRLHLDLSSPADGAEVLVVDLSDVVDAAGNPLLQTTLRVELRDELQPTALIRATLENDMVLDFSRTSPSRGRCVADAVSVAISGGTASIGPGLEV